jgi:prepilin-type N-terminal cleavage/methylation domain-containing protein
MKIEFKKAFTLIELLVVLGIIGVLASVIITSVNSARGKGIEVANKQSAKELYNVLQKEYSDNGSYSNLIANNYNSWVPLHYTCDTLSLNGNYASEFRNICNSIINRLNSASGDYSLLVGGATDQKFSIMIKTSKTSGFGGTYYCISSTGRVYSGSFNVNGTGCYYNP